VNTHAVLISLNAKRLIYKFTQIRSEVKNITYHNIILREDEQYLQRISQYLRSLLHNFIFITDG